MSNGTVFSTRLDRSRFIPACFETEQSTDEASLFVKINNTERFNLLPKLLIFFNFLSEGQFAQQDQ